MLRNILLHLAEDPKLKIRMQAAVALAAKHRAQLTGLFTLTPWTIPAYVTAYVPPDLIERERSAVQAVASRAKEQLERLCQKEDVKLEWREAEGDPVSLMAVQARYADLAMVGQWDGKADLPPGVAELPQELVLTSARPVLVVPYVGTFTKIGERILIAWKSTREAARAVFDALPLLEGAQKVIVLSVNPSETGHIVGADIAAQLARHGVAVEVRQIIAPDSAVADMLLAQASEQGCDLIVMGAWGHSRMRELALGGATRDMLERMSVPVFMSH
jgi:nucleotide-binding universal stress UspA family protein